MQRRAELDILNIKTPGIIDTTSANLMAAKDMCLRRETGARINATAAHRG